MHIELRKLKIIAALSEETACYSAEVWVDGQRAFLASNHGHGAADIFHPVGHLTEADVDAWLAANRAPTRIGDTVLKHTLEFEVAALMTRIEETKRLRRSFRTKLVVIEDGKVWSYPLKVDRLRPWRPRSNGRSQRPAWSMTMMPRSKLRSPS